MHEEDLERFALDAVDSVEHLTIELHTRECVECRKKLEESRFFASRLQALRHSQVRAAGGERRRDLRYEMREPAIVSATHPTDFEPFDCSVIDVSEAGLRIRGPREIYRGSNVRVRVKNAVVFGRISYSRQVEDDAFDSGIEIEQIVLGSDSSDLRDQARTVPGEVAAVAAPGTPSERAPRQPVEILLVEDNPADVKLTTAMLQETAIPHHLTVASDGAEALELLDLAEPKPDFVLLDLGLPKVDGFDVLQHIRSARTLRTIKVVVLSGSAAVCDVQRARELGVEAYLQKPEQLEEYADLGSRIGTLIAQTSP